ncbi:MAG: hypothetical protein JWN63_87 [Candidatus Acidoferrum typicum]|nr:hypothetical protein [Candidatus Acidoferrum typicum]
MKIRSQWGIGVHAGKIVSVVDGERVFIHLRSALETYSLRDIAARHSQRLFTVLIDNAQKVADHMSESFTHVKSDNVVVLLCSSDETRMAALAALGLESSQNSDGKVREARGRPNPAIASAQTWLPNNRTG